MNSKIYSINSKRRLQDVFYKKKDNNVLKETFSAQKELFLYPNPLQCKINCIPTQKLSFLRTNASEKCIRD